MSEEFNLEQVETRDGMATVLADDICITPKIKAAKRLDWDEDFNRLPEVLVINKDACVVDAGAYIGDSAATFARRGATVMAFEPREDAFKCLRRNAALFPNLHPVFAALGNGEPFDLAGDGINKGGRCITRSEYSDRFTIPLDQFWLDRLDFLKIDVEGWEARVLRGAKELIAQSRPLISVEINPHALKQAGSGADEVLSLLKEYGYTWREYYRYYQENWDLICTPKPKDNP